MRLGWPVACTTAADARHLIGAMHMIDARHLIDAKALIDAMALTDAMDLTRAIALARCARAICMRLRHLLPICAGACFTPPGATPDGRETTLPLVSRILLLRHRGRGMRPCSGCQRHESGRRGRPCCGPVCPA